MNKKAYLLISIALLIIGASVSLAQYFYSPFMSGQSFSMPPLKCTSTQDIIISGKSFRENIPCTNAYGSATCSFYCDIKTTKKATCDAGYEIYIEQNDGETTDGLSQGIYCALAGTTGSMTGVTTYPVETAKTETPTQPTTTPTTQKENATTKPVTETKPATEIKQTTSSKTNTETKPTSEAKKSTESKLTTPTKTTADNKTPSITKPTSEKTTSEKTTKEPSSTSTVSCKEDVFKCSDLSECRNGKKTRSCVLAYDCKETENAKPAEEENCEKSEKSEKEASGAEKVIETGVAKEVVKEVKEMKEAEEVEDTRTFVDTEDSSILKMVELMQQWGTFSIPKNRRFKATNKTTAAFAAQIAFAIAKQPCGSDISHLPQGINVKNARAKACLSKAIELGWIEEEAVKKSPKGIFKGDFYGLLEQALKLRAVDDSYLTKEHLCADVDKNNEYASIIGTAHYYGILKKYSYKGKKGYCLPNLFLNKKQAIGIALSAMETK